MAPGQAANRQQVDELFYQAASRLLDVSGDALAKSQLKRDNFRSHALEEYWFAQSNLGQMNYLLQEYGHRVPDMDLVIDTDDFTSFEVAWSCEVVAANDSCVMLAGWPVVGGQAIWAAESHVQMSGELRYSSAVSDPTNVLIGTPVNEDSPIPLGSTAMSVTPAGRNPVGILVAGIGSWKITRAQLILRALRR